MSETALRNVNAVRRSKRLVEKKQGPMKVVVDGPHDENQECRGAENYECLRGRGVGPRESAAVAKAAKPRLSKNNANAQMEAEAPEAFVQNDIEYVLSEDLRPLDNADAQLLTLLARLDSKEWLKVLEALNQVRRLAIFGPLSMRPMLNEAVTLVIKSLKNPRSALCKTALMATTDLFKAYQDEMLDVLDPLLLQLLLKATQDKRFVCEEAERALVGMTSYISPNTSLEKLSPYASHRNPRVRAKATACVVKSVSRLGLDGITKYGLEPLIQIAGAQLNDQLPEAREAARQLVVDLHAVHRQCSLVSGSSEKRGDGLTEIDSWEQFCLGSLNTLTAQAVLRVT